MLSELSQVASEDKASELSVLLFCRCRGASHRWEEACLVCAAEGSARASSHTPGGNLDPVLHPH